MKILSKRSIPEDNQPVWSNQQQFSQASSLLLAAILGQLLLITLGTQVLQFHGLLGQRGFLIIAMFILFHYALVVALVRWIMASEALRFVLDESKKAEENTRAFLQVVRAQRHDLMNHLQALAALFITGREGIGREYLDEMIRVGANINEAIQCNDPVLAAFLQARAHQASAWGVNFELDIGSAFDSIPVSTAYTLVGILGNLLDNAFEAVTLLPTDQRMVMCSIKQYEKNLIMCVRDNGPGIVPEHQERIFDPDFTTKGVGRGLGLALVQDVVSGIGGRVRFEHNPTTFTVWFPLQEVVL